MVYNWIESIQSFLLPDHCRLCGIRGPGLCDGCRQDLPRNQHCCPRCALPLPGDVGPGVLCGDCLAREPPFERSLVPFLYGYPLDHLIQAFKFDGCSGHGRVLAALLADAIERAGWPDLPEVLIPVPLHPRRLRQRGFNQALELARPLGRRLGIPVDAACCRRLRQTPAQAGLDRKHRQRNLAGAFAVAGSLGYRHLALVDDVVTTGATTAELARTLRRAGATRIEVWALARTPSIG